MLLEKVPNVVLLKGDATTAYRDPAVVFVDGVFHLFYTLVTTDPAGPAGGGQSYLVTAVSRSHDLCEWSKPEMLTPRDRSRNFSSPGNLIRHNGQWVMCLQTYPRPNGEKYANASARLFSIRSTDLRKWDEPKLLRVKGPDVPVEDMGRMIDPYFIEDRDEPGKWWCFYKQNGVSKSWSRDLEHWTYAGHAEAGENVCVIMDGRDYMMFHSPENGIGVKRSPDLNHWTDVGTITLDQPNWPWARGRLTAGFALDLRKDLAIGKCLLFFHGSGPEDERTIFDHYASIGVAWSDDLRTWSWPGCRQPQML